MPSYYQNILVVTAQELVDLGLFSSINYVSVKCTRHEKRGHGLERVRQGKGSNNQALIKFKSLPRHMQKIIGNPEEVDNILENYYLVDADANRYYRNSEGEGFSYPDDTELKPKTIEQLIVNASVMIAAVDLHDDRETEWVNKGRATRGLLKTVHRDVVLFNKVLTKKEELTHSLPKSYLRFKHAFDQFRIADNKFYTLIKDPEAKGRLNAQKCDDDHQMLLNNLFAQSNKPHYTKVARQYEAFLNGQFHIENQMTGEVYNPKDFNKLSTSAIKMALRKYGNKIGTFSKRTNNHKNLKQLFDPAHKFTPPTYAGSLISVDDRQPPFWYDQNRSRVWCYVAMDFASQAITCRVYGKSKEGIIIEFYRQLVRNYHAMGWKLPYQIEAEKSLNDSFKDGLLKPGAMFGEVTILPNNPRGKRIERHFGEARYGVEKDFEGWKARPHAKSESNQPYRDNDKTFIPYDKIIEQSDKTIEILNNTPHPSDPSISRWDYCCQNQNPNLPETNYKSILWHIGFDTNTSCNVGKVRFQNDIWLLADNGSYCLDEKLINLMNRIEGKNIKVKWLNANNGDVLKAMVFEADGRYICELLPQPAPNKAEIEKTELDHQLYGDFEKYRQTLLTYQKRQKKKIDKIGIDDETTRTVNNNFSLSVFGGGSNDAYQPRHQNETELIEIEEEFENENNNNTNYRDRGWDYELKN